MHTKYSFYQTIFVSNSMWQINIVIKNTKLLYDMYGGNCCLDTEIYAIFCINLQECYLFKKPVALV